MKLLPNMKDVKDVAMDGMILFGATKAFRLADNLAAKVIPASISPMIRKPLVAVVVGVMAKPLGARMARMTAAVGVAEAINAVAGPTVDGLISSVAGAPATAGVVRTGGVVTAGFNRSASTRGFAVRAF